MIDNANQPQQLPIWKIDGVTETVIPDPVKGFVNGYRVAVRFADGSIFTLDFPKSQFTADAVKNAVESEVEKHLSVRGLQGPLLP